MLRLADGTLVLAATDLANLLRVRISRSNGWGSSAVSVQATTDR